MSTNAAYDYPNYGDFNRASGYEPRMHKALFNKALHSFSYYHYQNCRRCFCYSYLLLRITLSINFTVSVCMLKLLLQITYVSKNEHYKRQKTLHPMKLTIVQLFKTVNPRSPIVHLRGYNLLPTHFVSLSILLGHRTSSLFDFNVAANNKWIQPSEAGTHQLEFFIVIF